ncbi:unnamed protein product [Adineta ricciae]|uniref:Uncharacterized protein n=1 Tax=Adineta ricciae TaxID=249248 RepID=A0A815UNS9_ADIRI|nr:unnamed protein product [Adineta ricciae]CAF1521967.1 unnamed protein product [Adineta ricciae]
MGTCCCHFPLLYKGLPHLHAFIAIFELLCGIGRLVGYFSALPDTKKVQTYDSKYAAAFALDWISSIVPTCMGLFIALLIIVVMLKMLIYCLQSHSQRSCVDDINTSGWLRKVWRNRALRRIVALDCNCPCYKPRPKLRFFVRFGFLCVVFTLKIIAIALYTSVSSSSNRANDLATVCAFTILCLFSTFLIDVYHYCVWWHYTPFDDKTCCCCRSRKHRRYLPYILIAEYRNEQHWGDRSCTDHPCLERSLEHIATFHYSSYKPQPRWSDLHKPEPSVNTVKKSKSGLTYIGFHQTTPQAAVSIAKSEFIPSISGMLGPGTYFARSLDGTNVKVGRNGGFGAWFIAEIDMGKVYVTEKRFYDTKPGNPFYNAGIHRFVGNGEWHVEYNTCYSIHDDDNLDEFCIKDPTKQILQWVIVIEDSFDRKVKLYGLDTEFDSTECGCC